MATPATWPFDLQQRVNEDGFSYQFGETALRSENDTGPAKVRRRFTKGIDTVTCTINLPIGDFALFRDFYNVSLNGGVSPFYFRNPMTDEMEVFRFSGPPKADPMGGRYFKVAMAWEKV